MNLAITIHLKKPIVYGVQNRYSKNFAKFTEKRLCPSLLLYKIAG